jgi:SOS-response transcriptional repressor LexA
MELRDWIRVARKAAGLTQGQLGEKLGLTKGNVSAWETGKHAPSYEQMLKICKISGIPLPAVDDKHDTDDSDAPIIEGKGGLIQDAHKKSRHTIDEGGPRKIDQNVARAAPERRRIPIISYVQAGMMTEAVDPYLVGDGFETITTDLELSGSAFGLVIKGPSMEPEFKEGDKVIIDPAVEPLPGDFVVAKNTEEEATFKKYRPRGTNERGVMVFELVPLNDDFPTLHSERDHLRVVGVMVEHRKYRRR